jgi:hypothetical protein
MHSAAHTRCRDAQPTAIGLQATTLMLDDGENPTKKRILTSDRVEPSYAETRRHDTTNRATDYYDALMLTINEF